MGVDLAQLNLVIDSTQAAAGAESLIRFSSAAKGAEEATSSLAGASTKAGSAHREHAEGIKATSTAGKEGSEVARGLKESWGEVVGTLGAVVGVALSVAGAVEAVKEAVSAGAEAQSREMVFGALMGGAKQAETFLNQLRTLSSEMPQFDFSGLAEAAKQLTIAGASGQQTIDILHVLGNTAAVLGAQGGQETQKLQELANMISLISQNSQYLQRGVMEMTRQGLVTKDVWKNVAQEMHTDIGTVQVAMREGNVTGRDAINLLLTAFAKTFPDGVKQSSQTVQGEFDAMRNQVKLTFEDMGESIIKNDKVRQMLVDLAADIIKVREALATPGGQEFIGNMVTIADDIAKTLPWIALLIGGFAGAKLVMAEFVGIKALFTTGLAEEGAALTTLAPEITAVVAVLGLLAAAYIRAEETGEGWQESLYKTVRGIPIFHSIQQDMQAATEDVDRLNAKIHDLTNDLQSGKLSDEDKTATQDQLVEMVRNKRQAIKEEIEAYQKDIEQSRADMAQGTVQGEDTFGTRDGPDLTAASKLRAKIKEDTDVVTYLNNELAKTTQHLTDQEKKATDLRNALIQASQAAVPQPLGPNAPVTFGAAGYTAPGSKPGFGSAQSLDVTNYAGTSLGDENKRKTEMARAQLEQENERLDEQLQILTGLDGTHKAIEEKLKVELETSKAFPENLAKAHAIATAMLDKINKLDFTLAVASLTDLTSKLKEENSLIGESSAAKTADLALWSAEKDLVGETLDEHLKLVAASKAYYDALNDKAAQEEMLKTAQEMGNAFGNAFDQILIKGKSVHDALKSLFESLEEDMFKAIVERPISNFMTDQISKTFSGIPGMDKLFGGQAGKGPDLKGAFGGVGQSITTSTMAVTASVVNLSGGIGAGGAGGGGSVNGLPLGPSVPANLFSGSGSSSDNYGNDYTDWYQGAGEGSAKGNAFGPSGKVNYFASGDVVDEPTPFTFGGGMSKGIMGEAGYEGVVPLARTSGGDLGVKVAGGGTTSSSGNTVIHNNSSVNVQATDTGSFSRSKKQIFHELNVQMARNQR
jgi:hypothetical protein